MSLLPESLIQSVRESLDVTTVLRLIDYRPETLQDQGDALRCFCPIHQETIFRTLRIDKRRLTYQCSNYNCDGNSGGDLIDLLARARGTSYEQALLTLAETLGIAVAPQVVEGCLQTTLEVARNYLELGALHEAEEQLNAVFGIRSDFLPALEVLVELNARQGRRDALHAARLRLAHARGAAGDGAGALEAISPCLNDSGCEPAIYREYIDLLAQAGRTEEAARECLALAASLGGQNELNAALEIYRKAQGLNPAESDPWTPMIAALLHAGRGDDAVAECLRMSEACQRQGNGEEAFDALMRAVELAPGRDALKVRLAELAAAARLAGRPLELVCGQVAGLLATGAHTAADQALQALEEAFAETPGVICLRADLEEALGNDQRALDLRLGCVDRFETRREFGAALDVLEQMLAERRGNIALLSRKANLLRAMQRGEEALTVYLEIADLFVKIDEFENAAGVYQTIVTLDPGRLEHRHRQVELYLRLEREPVVVDKTLELVAMHRVRNESGDALRLLERILSRLPESTPLLGLAAELYQQEGRRGEAAERFLASGRLLAGRKDAAAARRAFEQALRCVPEHLEAREALADMLAQQGDLQQAANIYRDLTEFFQRMDDPDASVRLAEKLAHCRPDRTEALEMLVRAQGRAGQHDRQLQAQVKLIDLHLAARDWNRAGELCEAILQEREDCAPVLERLVAVAEATRNDGNHTRHLWRLAQAHDRAGRRHEELAALERILAADPLHEKAWQRQLHLQLQRSTPRMLQASIEGFCHQHEEAGQIDQGLGVLEELAQSAESPKPELFAGMARLHEARGDRVGRRHALRLQAELLGRQMRDGEALEAWNKLAELAPDDVTVLRTRIEIMKRNEMTAELVEEYRRLAEALLEAGLDDEAQVTLLQLIGLRPRDLPAREKLIDVLIRRKDFIAAREQIEEASGRLLEEGAPQRALVIYQRIFEFDPDDQVVYRKLIAIHQRMDDLPGALHVFERLLQRLDGDEENAMAFEQAAQDALELEPEHHGIRRRLAEFYIQQDRKREAETLLLTLAVKQLETGALDEAETTLESILAINSTSVPARAHRAELLVRRGNTAEALSEFMSLTGQLTAQQGLASLMPQAETAPVNGRAPRPFGCGNYEGIPLIGSYTFENFIVGERNNFAHAAAMAVCRAPGRNYNPLFLYSDVGMGKTHLCHAIVHYIGDRHPELKIRYITMDEFITDLIDAIGNNFISTFRSSHKVTDLLIMDDVQFLSGKERAQEEFFHIFNTLFQAGKQVVLTSDRPPKDIAHLEKRLRSRFGSGIIVDIQPPDLETRVAILRQELESRGQKGMVSDDVLLYIAEQVTSNVRELKGAFTQVLARYEISGEIIDLPATRRLLEKNIAAT